MTKLEAAFAEFDRAIAEKDAQEAAKASAKPKAVVEKAVVKVARDDPNYSKENRGRVEVEVRRPLPKIRDVNEEAYWRAVSREMARPVFAEVIHAYDPFARERMPGYERD